MSIERPDYMGFELDPPPNLRQKERLFGGILGLAVGDALGVPVEFQSRELLRRNPVTGMQGYGTYKQPPGTWSDDTSLMLCLVDSLAHTQIVTDGKPLRWQPNYPDIMQRFLLWFDKAEYTAHDEVFDVGIATRHALQCYRKGADPIECGGTSEQDNGNGSLMRILPLAFYLRSFCEWDLSKAKKSFDIIHNVSSLTHAHQRSRIACGLYLSIAKNLESYEDTKLAIKVGLESAKPWYAENYAKELKHYARIFDSDFADLPEEKIRSSGYVVDTLEAALWCLLNTDNYKDCVLKAVNLGEDTDTVAAVAGGLAGIYYGVEDIPEEWLKQLARREYIEKLCEDFCRSVGR